MKKSLKEIAALIDGEIVGDDRIQISSVNGIREAQEGEITFLANPAYRPLMNITKASAIITSREIDTAKQAIIRTDNPSAAFAQIISMFTDRSKAGQPRPGQHKTAVIGENVKLGKGVSIGAFVVIEDNTEIGDSTIIFPHVYIGKDCSIGNQCQIYPSVDIKRYPRQA